MDHAIRTSGLLAAITAIVLLPACPSNDACFDNATCSVLDAGGNTPPSPTPPNCDPAADATSPAAQGCVADSFALFVDADRGDDEYAGTKDKPLRSISAAVARGAHSLCRSERLWA